MLWSRDLSLPSSHVIQTLGLSKRVWPKHRNDDQMLKIGKMNLEPPECKRRFKLDESSKRCSKISGGSESY